MSVPSKIHNSQLVKVQAEVSPPQNGTPSGNRLLVKPEGWDTATQVKGLSPEIFVVSEVDSVHLTEGSTLVTNSLNRAWQGDASPAWSETVARYQRNNMLYYTITGIAFISKGSLVMNLSYHDHNLIAGIQSVYIFPFTSVNLSHVIVPPVASLYSCTCIICGYEPVSMT